MIGVLVLLGALTGAPPAEVTDAVRDVFGQERYRFCHDDRYPLIDNERAWCAIAEKDSGTCPSFARACKAPPTEEGRSQSGAAGGDSAQNVESQGDGGGSGERDDDSPAGEDGEDAAGSDARCEAQERRDREREERRSSLPVFSGLGRLLFFVLLAAMVLVVARAILKSVLRDSGGEDEASPDEASKEQASILAAKPRGPVETDVSRLLARARAAAARGDYTQALDDTYAALLRRLDGDGLIDIHPSRTNGDYVRNLREQPELRRAVRDILVDVERVQFGASPPSEAIFRSVFDRVVPLVTRAAAVLLVFLGLSASLSACAPPHEAGCRGKRAALSSGTSPSGTRALGEILGKLDVKASFRPKIIDTLANAGTLVLLPGAELDAAAWTRVVEWVNSGKGSVIVAGAALPSNADLPRSVADANESAELTVGESFAPPRIAVSAVSVPAGSALEERPYFSGDVVLHRGDRVYAFRQSVRYERNGGGQLFTFADNRLFTNASLAVPENAAFVVGLLRSLPGDVEIVGWASAARSKAAGASSPYEAVLNARLLPFILQLLALLALFYLWKGRAFADLRDPPARSRGAFADHVRALGLAYARARASRHVLGLYASWILERLRERVHRGGRQGLIPLAEAIAARTGRSEADVMNVLMEATGAREEVSPASLRPSQRGDMSALAEGAEKGRAGRDLALMRQLESFLAAVSTIRRRAPRAPGAARARDRERAPRPSVDAPQTAPADSPRP